MNWKMIYGGTIDEWGPVRVAREVSILDRIYDELRENGQAVDNVKKLAPGVYLVRGRF